MAHFSNAELAQKLSDLVDFWSSFNEQYKDWLGGTVAGGPSSDGKYPLTDYTGTESLVDCPAKLSDTVGGYADQADGSATAAAASAAAASTSETNAATSAATATAQAALADADRVAAAASASTSQNAATTATTQANLATDRAGYASEWANKAFESLVSAAAGGDEVDDYSALHWATVAEGFAGSIDSNLYAQLAQDEVISGMWSFTHTPTSSIDGSFLLSSTIPMIGFQQTDASANNGVWDIIAYQEAMIFRTATDLGAGNVEWLRVERTGTTIDSITFFGEVSLKESASNNAAVEYVDTDNTILGNVGFARGTNEFFTGTSQNDLVIEGIFGEIVFGTNNAERMAIANDGTVNILGDIDVLSGVFTFDAADLTAAAHINVTGGHGVYFDNAGLSNSIYTDGSGNMQVLGAAGRNAIFSQFDGLTVTSSMTGTKTVQITNTAAGIGDYCRVQVTADGQSVALFSQGANVTTPAVTGGPTGLYSVLRTLGSGPLGLATANTERMRIEDALITSKIEHLVSSIGTNVAPGTDGLRVNGYGIMGNRGNLYITNTNASGAIIIGYNGAHASNIIGKFTGGKLEISGYLQAAGADSAPAAGFSRLSANMLHIDGKEAIDGNDTYLRLNQNGDFSNGVYSPNIVRFDGGIYVGSGGNMVKASSTGYLTIAKLMKGGFGANSTGGTLNWNDSSNARSGQGDSLLLGSATNGPGAALNAGSSMYYHPFTFEYSAKGGTGNMCQWAIPYSSANAVGLWQRSRYGGTWTAWVEHLHTGNGGIHYAAAETYTSSKVTVSTSAPSGGSNGDIWFKI
jgi:hypothetical protein